MREREALIGATTETLNKHPTRPPEDNPPPPAAVESNQLYTQRNNKLIKLPATINNHDALVLVDCGASDNFMDDKFAMRAGVPRVDSGGEGQLVKLGDGTYCRAFQSANDVPFAINGFAGYDDFQVMPLGSYDAILGIPWLTEFNPAIDWKARTMTIAACLTRL